MTLSTITTLGEVTPSTASHALKIPTISGAANAQPGHQTVKSPDWSKNQVQKARMQKRILKFEILDNKTVMRLYNSGKRDPQYADRLAYCLSIIG